MSGNSNEKTSDGGSTKTDATGEFFSVGSPLHAVRAGYVRRRADELLYEAARAGRYAHIIAPDRSGKSSLIAATTARLENNGVSVAVLDLAQIGDRDGAQDAGRWYYNVAYRLLRQLRIRYDLQSWWQDNSVLNNRQRLLEFYSEVLLQSIQQRIVIFVDEIQCIADLPYADQLLASIRSAHNARTTDPDFMRLTFVMLGECDPVSLLNEPELSPFNITQSIPLDDFSREDLNIFATELNLPADDAKPALDRIYHWTRGQPYLSQKLARAIARECLTGDLTKSIDRIVMQQLAGRAALHSEPHMSHIHREIVDHSKDRVGLLNLYGRLRKGVDVAADLGSGQQRRLMAIGLIEVDESGELRIRNRIYSTVFTTRWANENLPVDWRTPSIVLAIMIAILAVPFWYTQLLPGPYVDVLTDANTDIQAANTSWASLRSFPGHNEAADNLYRAYLNNRAAAASDVETIEAIVDMAWTLPNSGSMPARLLAEFWDRQVDAATREERRDEALLASLEALVLSTPQRRNRSAMLVGDDYPLLLASLPQQEHTNLVFNPGSLLLTATNGSTFSQWSLGPQGLVRSDDWTITALEVTPLVRRVIVDREGAARRIGLTLNISHPRMADLRIKLIAPSGRAVEIDTERERASSNDEIRIPTSQLAALVGESLPGTWSISFRDEATGVAGHLVGWNLTLNSQGLVEDFERGLGIPDPTERETENFWLSPDGRYAIARATQSDSVRLWDLAFAKPIAAVAVSESEQLIGVDNGARRMITATLDAVNVWDTATGARIATLPVGPASSSATLTGDGEHLFVQQPGDVETRLGLWNFDSAEQQAGLVVAGAPALVALDASGQRIAIADYDRAVRIWDFASGEMLAQLDLPLQPSDIQLNAGGDVVAAVFGSAGISLWAVDQPQTPMLEEFGDGDWQVGFSRSGARLIAGRPRTGFQVFAASNAQLIGPPVGSTREARSESLLAFNNDEDIVVTSGPEGAIRFWQLPAAPDVAGPDDAGHAIWSPSGDSIVAALPDASALAVADRLGDVHFIAAGMIGEAIAAASEDVSYLGHNEAVRMLAVSPDGTNVTSVAADNTLRVWNAADGLPKAFITALPGSTVNRIVYSADGSLLGATAGNKAVVVDVNSGDTLAELELGELHTAIAFGADGKIYLGSESGSLTEMSRDNAGIWKLQHLWQGESAIRFLELSPRQRHLVLVDQNNFAQQFILAEGRLGDFTVQLPGPVNDVAFSPSGSRVLFKTPRWVHRVGSSANGLIWLESMLTPRSLTGTGVVFGDPDQPGSRSGNVFYLPVVTDGLPQLVSLQLNDAEGTGLFGNKNALIKEWRARVTGIDEPAPDAD